MLPRVCLKVPLRVLAALDHKDVQRRGLELIAELREGGDGAGDPQSLEEAAEGRDRLRVRGDEGDADAVLSVDGELRGDEEGGKQHGRVREPGVGVV
eukprot:CAMPEP_0113233352 /NCGR_PEP_ID=MMETSP0008_2-20120614/2437_1 /TAXON_ID=97485 /ORGANISM="Prymnesium parvum" /LENGTH=96 /DNA_ID=CAMNT_0000080127 /DNA_START=563 /DNA_END=853 /DNA_ORIENTATION=- /assembly_acc=CAM_ASM_000153